MDVTIHSIDGRRSITIGRIRHVIIITIGIPLLEIRFKWCHGTIIIIDIHTIPGKRQYDKSTTHRSVDRQGQCHHSRQQQCRRDPSTQWIRTIYYILYINE